MGTEYEHDIQELIWQSYDLPYGSKAKISLLEQAVRLADTHNDDEEAFDARKELMQAAVFSGKSDVFLNAFAWCLAKCDADAETFPHDNLLWEFKWAFTSIGYLPTISVEQLEKLAQDMERVYRLCDCSMRAVYGARSALAISFGNPEQALKWHDKAESAPRDHTADCRACEVDTKVGLLVDSHDYAKALEIAKPIIAGDMSCAGVPHWTFGYLVLPMLEAGRGQELLQHIKRSYKKTADNLDFFASISKFMLFYALVGQLNEAVTLINRHTGWLEETIDPDDRMKFFLAVYVTLSKYAKTHKTIKLHLPETFAAYQASGEYVVDQLAGYCLGESQTIAQGYDDRNGNDYFMTMVSDYQAYVDTDYSL